MIHQDQVAFPCFTASAVANANAPSYDGGAGGSKTQLMRSLFFNLLTLKQKVNEVESVAMQATCYSEYYGQPVDDEVASSMAVSSLANLLQEIVQTASFMMLSCEQMALVSAQAGNSSSSSTHMRADQEPYLMQIKPDDGVFQICVDGDNNQGFLDGNDAYNNWYTHETSYNNNSVRAEASRSTTTRTTSTTTTVEGEGSMYQYQASNKMNQEWEVLEEAYDVVELEAADLLARYTHYCQVCGRGFKRDANLRMHMRSHGDQYKSSLISTPMNKSSVESKRTTNKPWRKYSCPQQGCRWNKNHVKFQPLKSIVCVKNHYKRSHCPKMFLCKKCNRKQFSVLSDLKTHEKYCGNIKWRCSCGITFFQKDKLMDHVALFVGHTPMSNPLVINSDNTLDNYQHGGVQ